MKPRVQVLLSTYNGMKFLPEQMQSLRAQRGVELTVLARDDGSRDASLSYLKQSATQWPALQIIDSGANVGVVPSFARLVDAADERCEYFAFCDQDDIWAPGKLETAALALAPHADTPALWFCRYERTDESLRMLSLAPPFVNLGFAGALIENQVPGCTMVFNRALLRLLNRGQLARSECLMHDWWVLMLAQSLGRVHYEPRTLVQYRQHQNNAVGTSFSWWRSVGDRWLRLRQRGLSLKPIRLQAQVFLRAYVEQLDASSRTILLDFDNAATRAGGFGRLIYALRTPLRRRSWLETLFLRAMIVLRRI